MQIIKDNIQLSFEQFSGLFPKEANILTDKDYQNTKLQIDGPRIKLIYKEFAPIFINIDSELERHKVFFYKNSPYKELLAKALGIKAQRKNISILDATGGFLGDSLLIYAIGVDSLAIYERNPIAAMLIFNAIENSSVDLDFIYHDSMKEFTKSFDVIYYDPMYSDKNEKTAPKKEMSFFREMIGTDSDAEECAHLLFEKAKSRLVIKRPIKAGPLIDKVSMSFKGKSTRYDVYLKIEN